MIVEIQIFIHNLNSTLSILHSLADKVRDILDEESSLRVIIGIVRYLHNASEAVDNISTYRPK